MPVDLSRYPKNWKSEIVPRSHILAGGKFDDPKCGSRCECCGIRNYSLKSGKVVYASFDSWKDANEARGEAELVIVVHTVAHLGVGSTKSDKMNVDPNNLMVLCQSCHLKEDIEEHVLNRAENKRIKKIKNGQMELLSIVRTNFK